MKKVKYFLPSIILMMMIFSFSNQTGSDSSSLSQGIVQWLQNNLHISVSEFIIRKGAHMSEYALLALTFYYGFSHLDIHTNKMYFFSFISSFLYACTDEYHQLFIGGRAGQWTDILIDATGSLIMIFFIITLNHFINQKKKP